MKPWLDSKTFETVVSSAPLVSIDLVVRDSARRILVGKRVNRPAKNFWFVPGGRILKNESISEAFLRITKTELGAEFAVDLARYVGLYEHFYEDSIFTDSGSLVSTHYVVNAFELNLAEELSALPRAQHTDYSWLTEEEFLTNSKVHKHSRWYLEKEKGFI